MKNIYFTVGPSHIYPTVKRHIQEALRLDVPSLSHRGKWFGELFDSTVSSLKLLLNIPHGYHVFFVASGTEGMERIIQNTVKKKSFHFISGSFGKRFFSISHDLEKEVEEIATPAGVGFDSIPKIPKDAELLCFTHNDTSTGVALPMKYIYSVKKKYPKKLIALDTVSSLPYVNIDYKYIDCVFFSVQKGFGLPAGLGVLVLSQAALEKSLSIQKGFHSFAELLDYSKKSQTPETPNVLDIYLFNRVLTDMLKIGIKKIHADTEQKAKFLYDFFDKATLYSPAVSKNEFRSKTTLVINVKDSGKVIERLKKKGIVLGSGYGAHKNDQIRIANFPAHTVVDVKHLVSSLRSA